MVWPLTPALPAQDRALARLASALLAAVGCIAIALLRRVFRPRVWMSAALIAGALAVVALAFHFDATASCVATYDGHPTIIGREYTDEALTYVRDNPGLPASDLLLDAAGQVDTLWTGASVARCRFWVSWGGLLAIPLLAICVGSLMARRGGALDLVVAGVRRAGSASAPASAISSVVARRPVYHAFISYRRLDRERAEALAEAIESRGFRVAVDFRDFRPNEPILSEMERCIVESRFVLCVITAQYTSSGFTNEEALMTKLLDLEDGRNRIVPLVFEQVARPAWMAGLVGIDFTASAQIDPFEKLIALLSSVDEWRP
jgi:hypothetical protein